MIHTEDDIIKMVIARIDEVSPGIPIDVDLGEATRCLIGAAASAYVLEFPVGKIPYYGEKDYSAISGGHLITPNDYVKPIRVILKGSQNYAVDEIYPWNSPKASMARKGVYARTDRPVVVESNTIVNDQDTKVLHIYPTTYSGALLSYVKEFDPLSFDDTDDKGFFEHYLWYLAYQTLVSMSYPSEIHKSIVANYINNL